MSYTRHWFRPLEIESSVFDKIAEDMNTLYPEFKQKVEQYEASADVIYIDGFLFPRIIPDEWKTMFVNHNGRMHQFCNTNGERFQLAVECALVVIHHHLKDQIIVTGDGEMWGFRNAMELVSEHLPYGEDFQLGEAPSFDEMGLKVTWTTFDKDGNGTAKE